ncbi:MAG: type IX secretion system protein PorQ [Bacteroidota bacterium]
MLNQTRLLYILLILPLFSVAQIGGKATYQFLNLVSSARQASLGGKVISVKDDDVNFATWNPALINSGMDGKLAFNYVDYFSDVNYGSVAYAHSFDSLGTFVAGVTFVDYGKFIKATEYGEEEGQFSANELALNVGYSYQIDSSWTVGANAKIINSVLDSWNSYGAAVDLGVTYFMPEKDMMLALVLRNAGMQLKAYSGHDKENEKLPFEIQFGISQVLEHLPLQWSVTFENLQKLDLSFSNPSFSTSSLEGEEIEEEVSILNKAVRHVVIGAELFPKRNFSVRGSYNFRRAAEMRLANYKYFGGFSFGFGMKVKKFRINYGRSLYHPAGGTNHFSIVTDLDEF